MNNVTKSHNQIDKLKKILKIIYFSLKKSYCSTNKDYIKGK